MHAKVNLFVGRKVRTALVFPTAAIGALEIAVAGPCLLEEAWGKETRGLPGCVRENCGVGSEKNICDLEDVPSRSPTPS